MKSLRIPQHNTLFSCDIAGCLLQVLLDERDRDSFRYLWFTDGSMREAVDKRFLIHVLGSGVSSCVSTYTTRHLAERIRSLLPENVYDAIRKRLYVNDGQESGSTLPETL